MKKNNKKGFTLIELLAVIVILAILATAAFTLVIPRINESRKKSFVSELSAVIDAAETYFFENPSADCFEINATNGPQYLKNYDSKKNGVVKKTNDNGYTISYTNGTYTTGTSLQAMSALQVNGEPTDIIVTGQEAADSCS